MVRLPCAFYPQNGKEALTGKGSTTSTARKNDFGSGARLGMAFRCVYRNWVTSGVNIFKNRKVFTKDVLEAYKLINKIAERALKTLFEKQAF